MRFPMQWRTERGGNTLVRGKTRRRPSRSRFAPGLVPLEPRALLATFVVSSPLDSGPATLRQAVAEANAAPGADTIVFQGLSGQVIHLTSGAISISDDLTIDGPGAGDLTVSGSESSSIFRIQPPAGATTALAVAIDGLTLADGRDASSFSGGAITAIQTNLTVTACGFQNNNALANPKSSGQGGAILAQPGVSSSSPPVITPGSLTIAECMFVGNHADFSGGAIKVFGTMTTITDSVFSQNTSKQNGGAIAANGFVGLTQRRTLTVENDLFQENQVQSNLFALGGAIFNSTVTVVSGSTFEGNQVIGSNRVQGGAIHGDFASTLTVQSSTFLNNEARAAGRVSDTAAGGAISGDSGTSLTVIDSSFLGNQALDAFTVLGGAIKNQNFSFGAKPTTSISGSVFEDNAAIANDASPSDPNAGTAEGGALYNESVALMITDSTFTANRAQGGSASGFGGFALGGGLVNVASALAIANSEFDGNQAIGGNGHSAGGGIGGAMWLVSPAFPPTTLMIHDSTFDQNQAIGGAGLNAGSAGGIARGGAISALASGTLDLTGLLLSDNDATAGDGSTGGDATGGALDLLDVTTTLLDSHLAGNQAVGGNSTTGGAGGSAQGGGLFSNLSLTMQSTKITGNAALGGAGSSGGNAEGGGLWLAGFVVIEDSSIHGNSALGSPSGQGLGGGLFLAPGTSSTIKSTSISGNTASTAGDNVYP